MGNERIVIISGPSGVGKSTVVSQLLDRSPVPMVLSISATTREPRVGEIDFQNYIFLSDDDFQLRRDNGDFLECKEVFGRGYWYGTLKSTVESGHSDGKWVLLEIDVEGAIAVKQQKPDTIMIFLHPGSMGTLEQRLRDRNTDSEDSIQRRLEVARNEIGKSNLYDHIIENKTINDTVNQICDVLKRLAG
jgi:guanylate kinase